MSLEQVGMSVAILMAGWSLIQSYVVQREQLAALKVKVDTMWMFQMRRAVSEAITTGFAERNSPLRVSEKALAAVRPLEPVLQQIARQHPRLAPIDLALVIEREVGGNLVEQVCLPYALSFGACVIAAVAAATGQKTLEWP